MSKSKNIFYRILCHLFIFLFSGSVYYCMEIIFKKSHSSHWTMFMLAGVSALLFIDGLNDIFSYDMDYLLQIIICATAITVGEFIVGTIWNSNYMIWDYRNMPFNLNGQICLPFYFLWMFLSAVFIPFLDFIEWKVFKYNPEDPPYYKVFGKKIFQFKGGDV